MATLKEGQASSDELNPFFLIWSINPADNAHLCIAGYVYCFMLEGKHEYLRWRNNDDDHMLPFWIRWIWRMILWTWNLCIMLCHLKHSKECSAFAQSTGKSTFSSLAAWIKSVARLYFGNCIPSSLWIQGLSHQSIVPWTSWICPTHICSSWHILPQFCQACHWQTWLRLPQSTFLLRHPRGTFLEEQA